MEPDKLTEKIIGAAIDVHRHLGPGLLESAYENCLAHELTLQDLPFKRQAPMPVLYKGQKIDCGFRVDLLVDDLVIVELKAVDKIVPIHQAQLLTYMRLAHVELGLLINFNVQRLVNGVKRYRL